MNHLYQIIQRPVVTEKTERVSSDEGVRKYVFRVARQADKHQIREAVEALFGVKVARVNTMIMHGKVKRFGRTMGRRQSWKKALVTLRPGHAIELFPEDMLAAADEEEQQA